MRQFIVLDDPVLFDEIFYSENIFKVISDNYEDLTKLIDECFFEENTLLKGLGLGWAW